MKIFDFFKVFPVLAGLLRTAPDCFLMSSIDFKMTPNYLEMKIFDFSSSLRGLGTAVTNGPGLLFGEPD